jgi:hypothetical protein
VYVPFTAAAGRATTSVGFHVAELLPVPPERLKAVRLLPRAWALPAVAWPGVKVPEPVVAVAVPDQ